MIEKLDIIKDSRNVIDKDGIVHTVANFTAIEKINELVDAVNEIMTWRFETDDVQTPAENVQDEFAEQRKWIGRLCKFRDDDDDKWHYSVLKSIDDTETDSPFWDNEDYPWDICEPVSPDDDNIYKGE